MKASWQVSLNEEAGQVSYIAAKVVVFEKAVFTSDKVVWENGVGRFVIDRVDLSLKMTSGDFMMRGVCKISPVPKRAF